MTATATVHVPSLAGRVLRSVPVVGRVIRDIEREIDTVYYLIVIFLTAVVLAVQTWGLAALVVTAVSLVPVKDSVVRLVTVHDMRAPQGMDRRVIVSPVSASDPSAGIGAFMRQVLPMMQEMERSRFRRPTSPPRPPAQP